ncbi:MAG: diguanylate cyclase [Candidatus Saccharibacteria bacterium]|nr:diguanylate cyclase [Pseudorhodobacter sp.]
MIGKILIVDDVSTNRIVFKVKLTAAGYHTAMAASGALSLRMAQSEPPDLILLEMMLPDMSGIEVLRQLKANPLTRRIPVVMFSSEQDQATRLAALQAGAEDFLARSIEDQTLLARLRGLFRAREVVGGLSPMEQGMGLFGMAEPASAFEKPGHVALVLHRTEAALHLRKQLASVGKEQFTIVTPDDMYADPAQHGTPDVYLIDADIGTAGGGLRVMSELLSRGASRHAAFCIYNRDSPNLVPAMAFDLGASDVVDQRISPSELAVRLHGLVRRKRDADHMRATVQDGLRLAMIDPLTGLHNRRYGLAQLNAIAARAQADGSEFAVVVVDLDRFKAVNDRWGHAAGDAVLIEVAGRLAGNLRASDLLARIGGEEFLIALPVTQREEAGIVAKRLCRTVQSTPAMLTNGTRIPVTISIGMTIGGGGATDGKVADLVDKADRALMQSKSGGRNMVTILNYAA